MWRVEVESSALPALAARLAPRPATIDSISPVYRYHIAITRPEHNSQPNKIRYDPSGPVGYSDDLEGLTRAFCVTILLLAGP